MNPTTVSSNRVTLRAGCPEDLPRILEVLSEVQLPLAGVPEGLSHVVVAEMDGQIAGVAGLERYGTAALLRSVAVAPSHQGKGIAGALVQRLLDEARQESIHDVYLRTTSADQYFPRFGFSPVGIDQIPLEVQDSVEFRGACPASSVNMVCCLRHASGAVEQASRPV